MEDAKRLNGGDGLKPCPFCGKVAEIFQFDYFWGVRCAHENCVGHDIEAYYDNADFAIKAWNKRMNTTEVVRGQWIPVVERLPDQSIPVLVITRAGNQSVQWFQMLGVYLVGTHKKTHGCFPYVENSENITHWMPLPEPPKIDG